MIRPVDTPVGQRYGENPTSVLPATHWVIKQFGNYQPDGHAGEDYPCPVGTPIRAVTSGRVVHVGFYGGSYLDNPYWVAPNFAGYCYVIDHGAFIGIYAHGKDGGARVRVGQQVSEAQVIGLSGNTGGSTGPHLHFEVLPDGFVVNSYMYGRIDPATIFAGAGLAAMGGTITPQQEDELSFTDDIIKDKDGGNTTPEKTYISLDTKITRTEKKLDLLLETVGSAVKFVAIDGSTVTLAEQLRSLDAKAERERAENAALRAALEEIRASADVTPEVTAAIDKALGNLSITLTTEGGK